MTPLEQIRKLYYETTAATIKRDLARAIEILKAMENEDERQRAAVYMDGLAQMRGEWTPAKAAGRKIRRP
jgi:hypothetical protein